jgi:hypothetical protein
MENFGKSVLLRASCVLGLRSKYPISISLILISGCRLPQSSSGKLAVSGSIVLDGPASGSTFEISFFRDLGRSS